MSSELRTERRGTTLVLTLSDPASRNSLSQQVFTAGVEALGVAESDPEVRAIVLRGDGDHFCGGGDLAWLQRHRDGPPEVPGQVLQQFSALVDAVRVCPKPVIASVEGAAADGGFALALACDLLVAAADARFVLSHGRLGLSPDGGSTWHLMQRVPRATVLEWLWFGDPVPVAQLQALGLVNRVTGHGEAFDAALALADRLGACAPQAVASAKELVNQWPQRTLADQAALERDHFLQNLFDPNAAEGLQAFAERRPPTFR